MTTRYHPHIKYPFPPIHRQKEMPKSVTVRDTSPIPLYFWDEDGIEKIPCKRTNPVKYGMPFGISVGPGGEEDKSTVVTGHVDSGEPKEIPFSVELRDCPKDLIGSYSGVVSVHGNAGVISVHLCTCSCVCHR